jgi:lysophospholipase L1-like esterase
MQLINFKTILLVILVIIFIEFQKESDYTEGYVLPPQTKILAFGDSITYGYGLAHEESYPSQLSNMLQTTVINEGVNGELSAQGLQRLALVLEKHQPNILILCHGGNDILRKNNLSQTKENIIKMVQLAQKQQIHVILIGVPKFEIISLQTAPLYYEIASELNVALEDESLEQILENPDLKIDNVHPNKKGYEILSKKLMQLIAQTYLPSYSL